jgi:hypothetical protein
MKVSVGTDASRRLREILADSLKALGWPSGLLLMREGEHLAAGTSHPANLHRRFGAEHCGDLWPLAMAARAGSIEGPKVMGRVVPLRQDGKVVGFLVLAGPGSSAAKPPAAALLAAVARSTARQLDLLRRQDRLQRNYLNTILVLLRTMESKDPLARGHSDRVAEYCLKAGRALGLARRDLTTLSWAALFHDIGKVGIVDAILQKKESLTPAEMTIVREHPVIGQRIVQDLDALGDAAHVIRHHHERWDGRGYPDALKGEEIPLLARILGLAEVFDTIVSPTPYKGAQPVEEAAIALRQGKGKSFDPELVDTFLEAILF